LKPFNSGLCGMNLSRPSTWEEEEEEEEEEEDAEEVYGCRRGRKRSAEAEEMENEDFEDQIEKCRSPDHSLSGQNATKPRVPSGDNGGSGSRNTHKATIGKSTSRLNP
jgi:hypothetical protein